MHLEVLPLAVFILLGVYDFVSTLLLTSYFSGHAVARSMCYCAAWILLLPHAVLPGFCEQAFAHLPFAIIYT